MAGPAFAELRGHPGGTWGFASAVIAIGFRGTRGHPDSQHCGKYMARQHNTGFRVRVKGKNLRVKGKNIRVRV